MTHKEYNFIDDQIKAITKYGEILRGIRACLLAEEYFLNDKRTGINSAEKAEY